jgi:signal peptidase I
MKKRTKTAINIVVNIVFYACVATICFICLQVFFFASFKIPSDSMSPSLETGDRVLVCKLIQGARLFNLFASIRGEQVDIYRLPGLRKIRRNEVLVFNFPHPKSWDKIEMHIMKYYVKRCIGLPGDKVSIRNGFYEVEGVHIPLGNREAQLRMSMLNEDSFGENVFESHLPYDSLSHWTIKDFGPLYIPQKDAVLPMNRANYLLYKRAIEWEQNAVLEYRDSVVYLNAKAIETYTFRKNYYFVVGDRVEDSQDSRYWGLLPEEYIVGKAAFIWKSIDPNTQKFRWDRFMKKIV